MNQELTQDTLDFLVSLENDNGSIPQFMIEWRDRLVKELTVELAKTKENKPAKYPPPQLCPALQPEAVKRGIITT